MVTGDAPATAAIVAKAVGLNGAICPRGPIPDTVHPDQFAVFAGVLPEEKYKLVKAFQKGGHTVGMCGDGANDALAIKKADLGIAMFDGAQATRQIASVVLVKNSFSDLPNGVKLADSIIQNIEVCASLIFNQVFLAFFLFSHPFSFTLQYFAKFAKTDRSKS